MPLGDYLISQLIFGFYSTNGKLKDWEDVVTRDQLMNSDSDVPILVIGTKHDLESQRGTLPGNNSK